MSPRVVIGKIEGRKTRVRYPSMMGGYINHAYSSQEDAIRNLKDVMPQQLRSAVFEDVQTGERFDWEELKKRRPELLIA